MSKPPSRRKKSTSEKKDTSLEENPASATITVTAVEVPELTEQEIRDHLHLERKVERAFFEAGNALSELRDRRLYRSTHKTFEDYCRERFGHNRRQFYLLMDAAVVFDNLEQKCDQFDHILPTAKGQVRPMTKLESLEQQEVWLTAVEQAGGKVPSGRIVKDVVDRIRERTKVPNPYHLGEICLLLPKDNPDMRGKSGYWGVVDHVRDFSCTVQTWDGDYTVKIEHLKSLELLDEDCKFMQQLCMRLRRLHEVDSRDSSVDWLLEGLGKQAKPYLSSLQSKLLLTVEREYNLIWGQEE